MPQDRITGQNSNHEQNSTPLRTDTRNFLQAYRNSEEFLGHYTGNLQLSGDLSLNRLSERGIRLAIWSRAFVKRLFDLSTKEEADAFLEPWVRWGEALSQILSTDASYQEHHARFSQVEIPAEIRTYQGDLQDEELKSRAEFELFRLTGKVRGAIDLIEGTSRPVSLGTIFMVQRVTNQPLFPDHGLGDHVTQKPDIKRIEVDGKFYITFFDQDYPPSVAYPDSTAEEVWNRWNQVELGKHIRYIVRDEKTGIATVEAGIVEGFDLYGAGDAMLFGPNVSLIGVIVRKDKTRFLNFTLLNNIRLDSEGTEKKDLQRRRT